MGKSGLFVGYAPFPASSSKKGQTRKTAVTCLEEVLLLGTCGSVCVCVWWVVKMTNGSCYCKSMLNVIKILLTVLTVWLRCEDDFTHTDGHRAETWTEVMVNLSADSYNPHSHFKLGMQHLKITEITTQYFIFQKCAYVQRTGATTTFSSSTSERHVGETLYCFFRFPGSSGYFFSFSFLVTPILIYPWSWYGPAVQC